MQHNHHLYVHPKNQELLWATINKTPLFSSVRDRENWFKHIIQLFYNKYPIVNDRETLQRINKETISYMIEAIKQTLPLHSPISTPESIPNISNYQTTKLTEKKQIAYNGAFEERQKQYEQMFAKPAAPEVDFTEKTEDSPISNMEELIEKHKREREEELNKYAPIQQFIPPQSNTETLLTVVNPLVDNKVADNKDTDNKDEIIRFLKNEIHDLSSKYEQLSKEINELRKMFPNKES
jgi:hypothetical protein